MDKKKKTKGIYFEATESQKKQIKANAAVCGMRQSEYILKRALGYQPKAVLPDAFFDYYDLLCRFLNSALTPESEKEALKLFDKIYDEWLDVKKQTKEEILKEAEKWQQQGSGPSKAGSKR